MIKGCDNLIRFANEQDAAEIAKLHVNSIKNIYTEEYFKKLSKEAYYRDWMEYLKRRDCRTLVYVRNSEILGFSGICLFSMPRKNAILEYFHVSENSHKQGIGRQLFRMTQEILANEGIQELEISYVEGNDYAKKYYEKMGSKYVGSFIVWDEGKLFFHNRVIVKNLRYNVNLTNSYILKLGLDEEYKRLNAILRDKYILFGIGAYYDVFFERFTDISKPTYIFDNNKDYQGLSANGVQVVAPRKTDIPIVITCSKYQEIELQLKKLGCKNYVAFYPWHDYS